MSRATTEAEIAVLDRLAEAWNLFCRLEPQHGSDLTEFHSAIHAAQNIIGCRVAQRADPETFPLRAATGTVSRYQGDTSD